MWECLLWSCHGFLHPVCTGILLAGPFLLPERGEDYGISHGDLPWHPLTLLGMWLHPQSRHSKREKWDRGWNSTFCSFSCGKERGSYPRHELEFGDMEGILGNVLKFPKSPQCLRIPPNTLHVPKFSQCPNSVPILKFAQVSPVSPNSAPYPHFPMSPNPHNVPKSPSSKISPTSIPKFHAKLPRLQILPMHPFSHIPKFPLHVPHLGPHLGVLDPPRDAGWERQQLRGQGTRTSSPPIHS